MLAFKTDLLQFPALPFPLKPMLQVQLKDPTLLLQTAFWLQSSFINSHSSISKRTQLNLEYPSLTIISTYLHRMFHCLYSLVDNDMKNCQLNYDIPLAQHIHLAPHIHQYLFILTLCIKPETLLITCCYTYHCI